MFLPRYKFTSLKHISGHFDTKHIDYRVNRENGGIFERDFHTNAFIDNFG